MLRLLTVALLATVLCPAEVSVVVAPSADRVTRFAASELVSYLARLYPSERLVLAPKEPRGGRAIVFSHRAGPAESFVIRAEGSRASIAASDARGALYAVYSLLDKLGCGFYLSYTTVPPARGAFTFDDWNLSDEPLIADRMVFNWHNFLSSASTWELADWQRYLDSAARMRFNGVMVHAYGNNPMFTFRFNGHTKPVGYLATTRSGRDWGTQHVNDVRRLSGGSVFDDAVFGASVAKGGDRSAAAVGLMKQVFAHAASRGLGVTFALDVDTVSANPQDMIRTLPASARIRSGNYELANPDTPEGYAYYKAQADQLLAMYPQITRLAIWFRNNQTPWTAIKLSEFPDAWRAEFAGDPADAPMFAIGKLVRVFQRALREGGHRSIELAAGSWRLDFLTSAHRYLPREATLIPLDWSTVFDEERYQNLMRAVGAERKLVPIVWAHHDDRTYIGRPYTPYSNFRTLLDNVRASGFGIIHWTTRPLDLYFRSSVDQTWKATANQSVEEACARAAVRTLGARTDYLLKFVTEAPQFGRETSDMFMDRAFPDPLEHLRRIEARLRLLESVDGPHAEYFRGYENFMRLFIESQTAWERGRKHLAAREFDPARAELAKVQPAKAIEQFAAAARSGEISGGEKALIVSLNLRWRNYMMSARQAVGLEPVRLRIGTVEREPLAQGAGRNTFHVDEQGNLWKVIDRNTVQSRLRVAAIEGDLLEPGAYRVNGVRVESRDGWLEFDTAGATEFIIERI